MAAQPPALTWTSVISRLRTNEADAKFRVPVEHIGHPLDEGMLRLNTESDDSHIDYGMPVAERTWCVVRHYVDAYDVQLVRIQPQSVALTKQEEPTRALSQQSQVSLANLPTEAPGFTIALGSALGAIAGALAGGGKGAAMGAMIGGSVGLAAVGVSNASSSPETAQAAQAMFLGVTTAALGGSTARRTALVPAPA
ncbi:MAG TPA: hypothetical protein DCQ33_13055, partial [Nitrospira sp.]|nr:hypothetical protein [Nitrospira sp.]